MQSTKNHNQRLTRSFSVEEVSRQLAESPPTRPPGFSEIERAPVGHRMWCCWYYAFRFLPGTSKFVVARNGSNERMYNKFPDPPLLSDQYRGALISNYIAAPRASINHGPESHTRVPSVRFLFCFIYAKTGTCALAFLPMTLTSFSSKPSIAGGVFCFCLWSACWTVTNGPAIFWRSLLARPRRSRRCAHYK